jgi:hypothetical protein
MSSVTRTVHRILLGSLLGLGAVACGMPSDEDVRAEFLRDAPTFAVESVQSGEGDGSIVYKHIRYTRPGTARECVVVWGYQQAEPVWRVFHKGDPSCRDVGAAEQWVAADEAGLRMEPRR